MGEDAAGNIATVEGLANCLEARGAVVAGSLLFVAEELQRGAEICLQESAAERIVEDAKALETAGAFSIVLELMPRTAAQQVTEAVSIPTIGIGAGPECDGQVLVLHDLLGLNEDFNPKFLKRYAKMGQAVRAAVSQYAEEVRDGKYPDAEHSH